MRRRSPILALIALAAAGYGLWVVAPDLRFALEGAPRPVPPAELADGRHVLVSGQVEPLGFRVELSGDARDAWLLADRRVIVLLPAASAPQPAGELTTSGRLFRGDRARGWHPAAVAVATRRGMEPGDFWILLAGETPAIPWGSIGVAVLLLLVVLLNVRWLHAWWRSRKPVAEPDPAD